MIFQIRTAIKLEKLGEYLGLLNDGGYLDYSVTTRDDVSYVTVELSILRMGEFAQHVLEYADEIIARRDAQS